MRSKQQTGFTLIELLVAIAVAAILAAMAIPSFNDFIVSTRVTSTMSQFTSDVNRARSEAIKRNARVLLCVRNTAGTDCGTSTNWQNGWLVCYDLDENGACDLSTTANPNPIAVRQSIIPTLTLTGSAATLVFNPNGTGGPGTLQVVSGTKSRTANIAATGNFSVSNP